VAETEGVGLTVAVTVAVGRGACVALALIVAVGAPAVGVALGRVDEVTLGVGPVVADTEDVRIGSSEPAPSNAQAEAVATLSRPTAAPIPIIRPLSLDWPFPSCNPRMIGLSAPRIAPRRLGAA
jgi:hypothetical protein